MGANRARVHAVAFLHAICGFVCLSRFRARRASLNIRRLLALTLQRPAPPLAEGAPADPQGVRGLGACGWWSFRPMEGRLPQRRKWSAPGAQDAG
jgi:hypothetical protein